MRTARKLISMIALAALAFALAGCYEELDESPQPQAQGAPSGERPNEGLIGPVHQTGNSALGKAKSSAENVVEQAEQHSQKVADQADEIVNNNDDDGR